MYIFFACALSDRYLQNRSPILTLNKFCCPRWLAAILLIIACRYPAWSQPAIAASDSAGAGSLLQGLAHQVGADIVESGRDGLAFVIAPLHFTWPQWALAAGLLGATGATISLDARVRNFAQDHQSDGAGRFISPWQYYGDERVVLAAEAGMYACGLGLGSSWWRETGREVLTSLALTGLSVQAVKIIAGRSRPYTGNGPYDFHPPKLGEESMSFPSVHTANAFAVSTILASRISNVWASIGLYSAAGFTVSQRIYSDNHWLSDAVMGAVLGTIAGEAVLIKSKRDHWAGAVRELEILPVADGSRLGVDVSGKFSPESRIL